MVFALLLSACGNTQDSKTEQQSEVIDESATIIEMEGGKIKEADVPADEKEKILAAFDEYIAAFNTKDIDRYVKVLSKNPQGFDYDKEIELIKDTFETSDVKMVESNAKIIKFEDDTAEVLADIEYQVKEIETNATLNTNISQRTVFVKENGEWRVTRIGKVDTPFQ